MANDERLKGPNASERPDRADEVQRHTVAPTPPAPSGQSINEIEQTPSTRDAPREDASAPARAETLFPAGDITRLRNQWTEIQAAFVDEPRTAVKRADSLVGDVLKSLSDTFAQERTRLESQWDREGDVTTEDFRMALRRYRAFFDRLLSI